MRSGKIVFVFCLLSVVRLAAATNDLSVARQALRDGLWDVARTHAQKVGTDEAKLVILESLAGEGKWKDIARLLDGWKSVRGDGFDYYRAVTKGDHAAAVALLRKAGSPEGCEEADLFEAGELAKSGKRVEAERIWQAMVAKTNVSRRVFALASANLMDADLLRKAYDEVDSTSLRRMVGLRLGTVLLRDAKTAEEGEKLVRKIIKDSPDADGAREAMLAVADRLVTGGQWKQAFDAFHEAIEIWPDVAKIASVQEGRAWTLRKLGRQDEALAAFRRATELASTDEDRARSMVNEGDLLQEMGRDAESMTCYRAVLEKYPKTSVAGALKKIVDVRELEKKGRELYRQFKFAEAVGVFAEVAKADAMRKPMMDFFTALCLYGEGRDDEACSQARKIVAECADAGVRQKATIWLAKFLYNRREWSEAIRLFVAFADSKPVNEQAAEALLWAARAAFADNDFNRAIQLSTQVAERYPESKSKAGALLLQGEALIEQTRFDEAVLVFEKASTTETASSEDRARAQMLRADALFALGADNPARYATALEIYRAVSFGGKLGVDEKIVVSFKIARVLEKLKRTNEAIDLYYSQVVLAYRDARLSGLRLSEAARTAFSRAALRLADEYESRGKDRQATRILKLVVESDVPAADEAAKRIQRLSNKGKML